MAPLPYGRQTKRLHKQRFWCHDTGRAAKKVGGLDMLVLLEEYFHEETTSVFQ